MNILGLKGTPWALESRHSMATDSRQQTTDEGASAGDVSALLGGCSCLLPCCICCRAHLNAIAKVLCSKHEQGDNGHRASRSPTQLTSAGINDARRAVGRGIWLHNGVWNRQWPLDGAQLPGAEYSVHGMDNKAKRVINKQDWGSKAAKQTKDRIVNALFRATTTKL